MTKVYLAWEQLHGRSGHGVGRSLLRQLYEANVGGEMPQILIAPLGKPYFVDSPWHFSISHTKSHAFCVLADVPVGIDAEELCRKIRPETAKKLLSESEYAQYAAAADPNAAMLHFWVLKEATAKLTGTGIRKRPNTTEFSLDDPSVQILDDCLVAVVY